MVYDYAFDRYVIFLLSHIDGGPVLGYSDLTSQAQHEKCIYILASANLIETEQERERHTAKKCGGCRSVRARIGGESSMSVGRNYC